MRSDFSSSKNMSNSKERCVAQNTHLLNTFLVVFLVYLYLWCEKKKKTMQGFREKGPITYWYGIKFAKMLNVTGSCL